ncbi:4Fe-4S dicluster domain-containing protein [Geodermatophilus obscurus]|uniref:4Fe-4S ferredoxin iron-sulfur binding domain protein n=1 Tax=Geodermatophilus obscurus (strain ATCC 25078 / DSM 43160 / JCM 3152 / CCUG 61914 / KCC A-0152 / KCTC 9177 / NBRC 13315 / NRRL B-3577 / G-20) TaxID=526225 RepID=D2S530_GEOOG|nr:4Fe-4S dicluster domain-containing protein [Geodermatophilus obscurus]ADB73141.1 4Fe-4S ferredoxin iron-sulfur binding domain protein [Geodermatophilus obscurus DSM 43160]
MTSVSSASPAFTGRDPDNRLYGPLPDVQGEAGYDGDHPARVGFFTDTSVCIGCKACEVACKEWNFLPMDDAHGVRDVMGLSGMSYDNTGQLGANSWRHVAFIEQTRTVDLPMPTFGRPGDDRQDHGRSVTDGPNDESLATAQQSSVLNAEALSEFDPQTGQSGTDKQIRWLMSSDVCKHCTHAGCLDVCPTGALFRTEFGTVVVQGDICNGCGYCVPSCPYGVIEQRKGDGRVFKCTMCYDRLTDGLQPACATACPTQSIQFGNLDELQARADARLATLKSQGVETARLYGRDEDDGVGGAGAFFLLLDEPEVYGLPPDPIVTTRDLPAMWKSAGAAAAMILGVALSAVLGSRRK